MSARQDEKLLDDVAEHLRAAEIAIEFVERYDEKNGWYSSRAQLSHAIAELQAVAAQYDAAKAAHDRLYR